MLENFSRLIEWYGFVPNGNRVYFERRSQPPLFAAMVAEYLNATDDLGFLQSHIASLDKEFEFWRANRCEVHLTCNRLAQPDFTLARRQIGGTFYMSQAYLSPHFSTDLESSLWGQHNFFEVL